VCVIEQILSGQSSLGNCRIVEDENTSEQRRKELMYVDCEDCKKGQ